jgi:tetratricopeptide (TPR) repeat protein
LIEQTEEQWKRSPKSLKLINSLASYYEAAGRREDALKLRTGSAGKTNADPNALIQNAMALSASNKHAEAVEQFLEALRKKPDFVDERYYEMQSSFNSAKAWGKMVDLFEEIGMSKMRNVSYRLQEMGRQMLETGDTKNAARLFKLILEKGDVQQFGYVSDLANSPKFEFTPELQQVVLKRLTDEAFFANANQFQYVQSYSDSGKANNYMFQLLANISKTDAMFDSIRNSLEQRLEKSPKETLPRAMLAIVYASKKKLPELEKLLQPWNESTKGKKLDANASQAIWCIASQIDLKDAEGTKVMLPLLEYASRPSNDSNRSMNQFQYSPAALLVTWYAQLGRRDEARKMLMTAYKECKLDPRYSSNPGYAESRLLENRLQIATMIAKSSFPVDAYILMRRIQADKPLQESAKAWGGNQSYYMQMLEQTVSKSMTPDTCFALISQTLGTPADLAPVQVDQTQENKAKAVVDIAEVDDLLSLELSNTHSLDYTVDIPLVGLVDKIAKTPSLKTRINAAVAKVDVTKLVDPQQIAWTYVVAKSGGNDAIAAACVSQAAKFLDAQPDQTFEERSLPKELALIIMAKRLSKEGLENDLALKVFQRSESIAKQTKQMELARTLRCNVAERLASSDPTRSKSMLMELLDEIMPIKKSNKE